MASVFKRGRDKTSRTSCWYIAYTDHDGRRRTRKGFRDKGLTEQLASKIETEVMLRRSGLIDPAMERLTSNLRRPIVEHVADYEQHLLNKNGLTKHVRQSLFRIRSIIAGGSITCLADLDKSKVENFLAAR